MFAVVTGAASGIGREVALQLAQRGYTVAISDRDEAGLASTADSINAAGRTVADSRVVDVTDVNAVKSWADDIVAAHGVPDQIHHVAGIAIWGDVRTMPHEKWQRVIDVNLMGSVHMVEAFAPKLMEERPVRRRRRDRRKFVFVSSAAGIIGLPWHAAYSASKGGVLGMCEVLRFDMAPYGVDVHAVAPGAVDTPLVRTIDIHGVDRSKPRIEKATALFQGHAVSPSEAAQKILRGVDKGKYLINTSGDIPLARWAQVNAPWAYKGAMKALNAGFRWASK
ncbi:SDR family oxidoreductase [uncultured Corynebacterium sp.]|uniref:SDR family oxidoreductase n=1 Tax=uncultured Corynebacterium sp. TaxID=159447 RepID=UPI0025FBF8FC|nr:SDR family oxidoreductase [uncultured Corynebacterium sp.]